MLLQGAKIKFLYILRHLSINTRVLQRDKRSRKAVSRLISHSPKSVANRPDCDSFHPFVSSSLYHEGFNGIEDFFSQTCVPLQQNLIVQRLRQSFYYFVKLCFLTFLLIQLCRYILIKYTYLINTTLFIKLNKY